VDRLNTSVDQSDTTAPVASGGQDTAVQANPMVEIPSSCMEILTWIKRDPGEDLFQNVEDTLSENESMGSAFSRGNAADSVTTESQHPAGSAGIPTGELTMGSIPPEGDTGSIPPEVDTGSIPTEVDTENIPTEVDTESIPTEELTTGSFPAEVDMDSIPTKVDTAGEITDDNGGAEEQELSFSALEKGMDI
jgi:hypothetical protein